VEELVISRKGQDRPEALCKATHMWPAQEVPSLSMLPHFM